VEAVAGDGGTLDAGQTGISRAVLLQTGAAGAIAVLGLTSGGHVARAISALVSGSPQHLMRSSFTPYVGSAFRVRALTGAGPPVRMRLTEIGGNDQAFSLLFAANRGSTPLAGGLHRFEHPQMGGFQLAIGPVGRGVRVRQYEAIVNRLPGPPRRPRA
jgi:hypothetical protein